MITVSQSRIPPGRKLFSDSGRSSSSWQWGCNARIGQHSKRWDPSSDDANYLGQKKTSLWSFPSTQHRKHLLWLKGHMLEFLTSNPVIRSRSFGCGYGDPLSEGRPGARSLSLVNGSRHLESTCGDFPLLVNRTPSDLYARVCLEGLRSQNQPGLAAGTRTGLVSLDVASHPRDDDSQAGHNPRERYWGLCASPA